MTILLKQSQTAQHIAFLMIDSTDHITGKTGLTCTVTLSKNCAAFGAAAGTVTEIGNGWYKLAGNATDSGTLGPLALHATAAGADATDALFLVVAFDPQSATNLGLSNLDAAVTSRSTYAGADTAGTTTLLTRLPSAITLTSGAVTVGTNTDKTGYALTQTFPANFSSLTITGGGTVTAGTVSDKTGYSLTQTFPANFSSLTITGGGAITAGVVSDKTGYSLVTSEHTAVAADVLNATAASYNTAGSIGNKINSAASAGDPWTTSLPGSYAAGQAGYVVGTNLNATVGSRSTFSGGAVASVTAGVTVTTNNDKTGYALTNSEHTAIGADVLDAAQSAHNTSGTIGNKIGAAGGLVSGVTVTTNNDKTGYALSTGEHTAIAVDILDTAASGHNTSGTIGNKINSAAAGTLDLTQVIPSSNTAGTLGDSLNAARAQGFGKWVISGTTLSIYGADGATVVRTFTLNDATNPTQRV